MHVQKVSIMVQAFCVVHPYSEKLCQTSPHGQNGIIIPRTLYKNLKQVEKQISSTVEKHVFPY